MLVNLVDRRGEGEGPWHCQVYLLQLQLAVGRGGGVVDGAASSGGGHVWIFWGTSWLRAASHPLAG